MEKSGSSNFVLVENIVAFVSKDDALLVFCFRRHIIVEGKRHLPGDISVNAFVDIAAQVLVLLALAVVTCRQKLLFNLTLDSIIRPEVSGSDSGVFVGGFADAIRSGAVLCLDDSKQDINVLKFLCVFSICVEESLCGLLSVDGLGI